MKRRLIAVVLAAAMTVTAVPMSAGVFAADKNGQADATLQDIAQQLQDPSNDPFDYVNGGGLELDGGGYSFPNRLDLRNFEGQNYITPVKCQAPYGTCWGFAAIAAAESSILSNEELNKDEETGEQLYSTSLKRGGDGLPVLDLSEKHLAYFVSTPLRDPGNPQDGEGTYVTSGKTQDGLNNGGLAILASNSFASGIGPNLESRDECLEYKGGIRQKDGTIDYSDPTVVRGMIDGVWKKLTYSDEDDWSIDESWRINQSYVLKESYMLPTPAGRNEKDEYVYNPEGTRAIKEQLNQKRAVEIAFGWAPMLFGDGEPQETMNYDNWAYYTPAPNGANHAVTVVGYDDNYPRDNFAVKPPADMFPDGVHEGATDGGNGAWLIKNSWGSEEEEFPNVDQGDWGLFQGQDRYPYTKDPADNEVNTGYFWLSYYDQSLDSPEALAFDRSNVGKSYILDLHDYMPVYEMAGAVTDGEVMTSNVFDAEYGEKLEQISFFTAAPDTSVEYAIYLLQDDFDDPTDGSLVAFGTGDYPDGKDSYPYGGFHKVTLDNQPIIARGQKYSIVIKESVSGKSAINMPVGLSEKAATSWDTSYQKGIINPKESYVYVDGEWKDYSDKNLQVKLHGGEPGASTYDNFPIKGYCSQTNNDLKMSINPDLSYSNGVVDFCTYPGFSNEAKYFVRLRGSSDIAEDAEVRWAVTDEELFTLEPDEKNKDHVLVKVTGKTGKCYLECIVDGVGSARIPLEVNDLILNRVYSVEDEYAYTGKPIKPDCTCDTLLALDLVEGEHFILKFEKNIKCGKAKITALPGNEKIFGKPTGSFIIVPAKSKVAKLTPGKKSLKVKAKEQKASGLTGYQISYRVKGTKKWKTTTSTKNVKTIKKLKKGKKYQVRVRGYVKVGKKSYYGAWSKTSTSKKIK